MTAKGGIIMNEFSKYTIRIDKNVYMKFKYIADYEDRSVNKELERMIRKRVEAFEKAHGEITQEDLDNMT